LHYTDVVIFVLGYFILAHPVRTEWLWSRQPDVRVCACEWLAVTVRSRYWWHTSLRICSPMSLWTGVVTAVLM